MKISCIQLDMELGKVDENYAKAEKLGMVPAEELEHRELVVTVGQAPEEPTAWENFLWFVKGLLNGVDESRAEVFTDWEIGSVS